MKVTTLAFTTLMSISLPALAQEPPPPAGGTEEAPPAPPPPRIGGGMGAAGQIVLAADLPFMNTNPLFAVVRTSASAANGGPSSSSTLVAIAPSADYFVAPNISLGGLIGFALRSGPSGASDVTTFAVLVRAGYSAQLTESLSLWGRLGIGYTHTSTSSGGFDLTNSVIPLIVELPLLWHPAPHFFIGAGPNLTTQLSNAVSVMGMSQDTSKTTSFGATTMIGGYFGGT